MVNAFLVLSVAGLVIVGLLMILYLFAVNRSICRSVSDGAGAAAASARPPHP